MKFSTDFPRWNIMQHVAFGLRTCLQPNVRISPPICTLPFVCLRTWFVFSQTFEGFILNQNVTLVENWTCLCLWPQGCALSLRKIHFGKAVTESLHMVWWEIKTGQQRILSLCCQRRAWTRWRECHPSHAEPFMRPAGKALSLQESGSSSKLCTGKCKCCAIEPLQSKAGLLVGLIPPDSLPLSPHPSTKTRASFPGSSGMFDFLQ